jgi:hypothetical protein
LLGIIQILDLELLAPTQHVCLERMAFAKQDVNCRALDYLAFGMPKDPNSRSNPWVRLRRADRCKQQSLEMLPIPVSSINSAFDENEILIVRIPFLKLVTNRCGGGHTV